MEEAQSLGMLKRIGRNDQHDFVMVLSENHQTIRTRSDYDLRNMQGRNVLEDSDPSYFQKNLRIYCDMKFLLNHSGEGWWNGEFGCQENL